MPAAYFNQHAVYMKAALRSTGLAYICDSCYQWSFGSGNNQVDFAFFGKGYQGWKVIRLHMSDVLYFG